MVFELIINVLNIYNIIDCHEQHHILTVMLYVFSNMYLTYI